MRHAAGGVRNATLTSQPVRPGCVAVLAQNCLQDLLKLAAGDVEGLPVRAAVLTSDRWRLWLGMLFVLSVCYGPTGVRGGAGCPRG